jgi:uncharacterized protein (TIGR00730 family)
MKKTVTVFGSSLPAEGEPEYEAARRLGALLAQNGFNVCNGGNGGIMEAVSRGAVENGGFALGISVKHFKSTPNRYLSELIVCDSLFERITKLVNSGDAYVILRGGTGSLLELAAVWELINKNFLKHKPVACHSEMWRSIVAVMEKQIEREGRPGGVVKCFDTIEEIASYITAELG